MSDFVRYEIAATTIDGPALASGTEVSLKVLAVVKGGLPGMPLGLRICDWAGPVAEEHNPAPAATHDCDIELRGTPGFHPGQCRPDTFRCSCGTRYAHVCDEAEGCWWEAMSESVAIVPPSPTHPKEER